MDHPETKCCEDELLPELEISLIPSKLGNVCKVDLFGLDDSFIEYLVVQLVLPDRPNNDVHMIAVSKVPDFVFQLREWYKRYKLNDSKVVRMHGTH